MRHNYTRTILLILFVSTIAIACNNPKSIAKRAAKIDCQQKEIREEAGDLEEDAIKLFNDEGELDDADRKEYAKIQRKIDKLSIKSDKLSLKSMNMQKSVLKMYSNKDKWEDFDEDFEDAYDDAYDKCD